MFLGRDFGHTRNYSEEVAAEIDEEINAIITGCYDKTREILSSHIDKLHAVAQYLFQNEKLDGEQFKALMEGREVPDASETGLFASVSGGARDAAGFRKPGKARGICGRRRPFPLTEPKTSPLPSRGDVFLYPVFFLPRTPVFFPEMAGKDAELFFIYLCEITRILKPHGRRDVGDTQGGDPAAGT